MRTVLLLALCALLTVAVLPASRAQPQAPAGAASGPEVPSPPPVAELFVVNDSGPTLFRSNQVVTDNGARLVSLPRLSKLQLAPGTHLLEPDPPLWEQQVLLNVTEGKRYFVVVAYKPARSWAFPLGDAPLILHEISEERAAPLLNEMKAQ